MNNKVKNFLLNGLTYGLVFFTLSFILCYSFNFPLKKTLLNSTTIGLTTFVLFGLIQSRFTKSLKKLEAITIFPQIFETVKLEAPANHMINDHLISGKLFFSDKRLIFIDCNNEELSWTLSKLHSYKFHPSFFNAGGEFIIQHDNNDNLVFEVDDIRLWKRFLLNK